MTSTGSHPTDDHLFDLLHGLLPREDAEATLAHIAGCPACEATFRARDGERERFRAARPEALRDMDIGATRSPAARAAAGWGPLVWMRQFGRGFVPAGAAVAVAVIVLAIFLVRSNHGDGLSPGEEFAWLPDPGRALLTRGSAQETADANIRLGLKAYADHDLRAASRLLAEAEAAGSLDAMGRIYLASALAGTGRFGEAVSALADVQTDALPEPWRSEARWTLAIAYSKSGHAASGDSLLAVLAEESGPVGDRARGRLQTR